MGRRGPNITFEEAQEIIRLRDIERKTFKEIAEILGRSEQGVRRAYHRFKERMSCDRGEVEAKLIRMFRQGYTPIEAAEKLKIPLETVQEVWDIYKILEEDAKVVKIKKEDLPRIYIEGANLLEFLKSILSKFVSTKLEEVRINIRDIYGTLEELELRLNDLKQNLDQEIEKVREEIKKVEGRTNLMNNEIERLKNVVEELYVWMEKQKKKHYLQLN